MNLISEAAMLQSIPAETVGVPCHLVPKNRTRVKSLFHLEAHTDSPPLNSRVPILHAN